MNNDIYKSKYVLQFLNQNKDALYIEDNKMILDYEIYDEYLDLTIIGDEKEERTLLLDTSDREIKMVLSEIDKEIIEFKNDLIPLQRYLVYLADTYVSHCEKNRKTNTKEKINDLKICMDIMTNIDYYFFEDKAYEDNTDKWYYHTDDEIYTIVDAFEIQLMEILDKYKISYMDEPEYRDEFEKKKNNQDTDPYQKKKK